MRECAMKFIRGITREAPSKIEIQECETCCGMSTSCCDL